MVEILFAEEKLSVEYNSSTTKEDNGHGIKITEIPDLKAWNKYNNKYTNVRKISRVWKNKIKVQKLNLGQVRWFMHGMGHGDGFQINYFLVANISARS